MIGWPYGLPDRPFLCVGTGGLQRLSSRGAFGTPSEASLLSLGYPLHKKLEMRRPHGQDRRVGLSLRPFDFSGSLALSAYTSR